MKLPRVEVDLNAIGADGLLRVPLSRVDDKVRRGDVVNAVETDDGIRAWAYVSRVDERAGYAFLIMNWESMRDDDGTEALPNYHANVSNRAVAAIQNSAAARSDVRESRVSYGRYTA